jgi:hypothetical protein
MLLLLPTFALLFPTPEPSLVVTVALTRAVPADP